VQGGGVARLSLSGSRPGERGYRGKGGARGGRTLGFLSRPQV